MIQKKELREYCMDTLKLNPRKYGIIRGTTIPLVGFSVNDTLDKISSYTAVSIPERLVSDNKYTKMQRQYGDRHKKSDKKVVFANEVKVNIYLGEDIKDFDYLYTKSIKMSADTSVKDIDDSLMKNAKEIFNLVRGGYIVDNSKIDSIPQDNDVLHLNYIIGEITIFREPTNYKTKDFFKYILCLPMKFEYVKD